MTIMKEAGKRIIVLALILQTACRVSFMRKGGGGE